MINKQHVVQYSCWLLLIASCGGGNQQKIRTEDGLLQVKTIKEKTIVLQFMPNYGLVPGKINAAPACYTIKLLLKTGEKITDRKMLDYFNFGIKNAFSLWQDGNALQLLLCERLPGMQATEYLYMIVFEKPAGTSIDRGNLRFTVADTLAGFGNTMFEIKTDALKQIFQ